MFIQFFLISVSFILFTEVGSSGQFEAYYISHLLATINNSTCDRKWIAHYSLAKSANTKTNSSFFLRSRRDTMEFHRACKKEHKHWKFCILDRSPMVLRWSFSSVVTCEGGQSMENFHLLFNDDHSTQTFAKHVNLVHESINQDVFTRASRIQSRRTFVNETDGFVPIAILATTLCHHLNASVTVLPTYKHEEQNHSSAIRNHTVLRSIFESPTVHPRMFARTLTKLDRVSYIDSSKYVRIDSVDFNFVYCDSPKRKSSNMWDLAVIFQAFETNVWILLLGLLLLCSIILSVVTYSSVRFTLIPAFALALFSGMLGGNQYFGMGGLKYSVLFTVWMVASMILSNYYTGSMTSLLIKPTGEEVMSRLSDLDRNNFTLVFTDLLPSVFEVVNASAYGTSTETTTRNATNVKQYNQTAEMSMLRRILGSNSRNHHLPLQKFLERVATGKRKSALGPWPFCLAAYNRVMTYISTWNSQAQPKDRIFRHCHLGKELVPSGGLFWGFFPPENAKLETTFNQLLETGIYEYWMEEFYGLGYASRVQDRSKVKSPTNIIEDSAFDSYSPLNLREGHLSTIFVLWLLGISICTFVFILEIGIAKWLYKLEHNSSSTDFNISYKTLIW